MSDFYLLDTNVVLALVRGAKLGAFIDRSFGLRASKRRPGIKDFDHLDRAMLTVKYIDPTSE
jgi:hypothetical protein